MMGTCSRLQATYVESHQFLVLFTGLYSCLDLLTVNRGVIPQLLVDCEAPVQDHGQLGDSHYTIKSRCLQLRGVMVERLDSLVELLLRDHLSADMLRQEVQLPQVCKSFLTIFNREGLRL